MLNIKTVKNLLITDESKDSFCFRSSCSQTLKTSQLATEMADWNSSFTEADYLGMLSVMETIVTKYLAKGYNVTLPFGTLRANATGTCSNIQDGFTLGTGNHTLALTLRTKTRACSLKTKAALHAFPSTIGVAQTWLTFQFQPTLQAEVTV